MASLVGVAVIVVLVVLTVGLATAGAAVIARHRAQAAADLAALAAAERVAAGAETACARASAVAQAMRTAVVDCAVDGLDVVLSVQADTGLRIWRWRPAQAAARAGPGDEADRARIR